MKKLTFIAALVFCCSFISYAQYYESYTDEPTLRLGVKGGLNLSNLNVRDVASESAKLGYNLGLFAKLPVSNTIAIQPEILYSNKGAKLDYTNFAQGRGEYRFNLNYLELPVLGIFTIGNTFSVHAGPYIAYLSSSNIKELRDDGTIQGIADIDVKNFNRFDYGLAAGLGFDFNGFIVGARYNYGLREVGQPQNLTGELMRNSRNGVASLYVGFGF